jgi:hypothetical protein
VVCIGDVDTGAEHVSIPDSNATAGVDHNITVEIITIANNYARAFVSAFIWPKPASRRESVSTSQSDLRGLPDADVFEATPRSDCHSHKPIPNHAEAARDGVWRPKQKSNHIEATKQVWGTTLTPSESMTIAVLITDEIPARLFGPPISANS